MLNFDTSPKVIISASGMCEAGRIRHHLKHNLWNPKSSIIFVGYQAEGSLGRSIVQGAESVVLFGEEIQINAEVYNLEGFSGHADRDGLFEWISGFENKPHDIFLVHGETESKHDFAALVKEKLGYDCIVIDDVSEFALEKDTMLTKKDVMASIIEKERFLNIKSKIAEIHDDLERILYNAELAVNGTLTPERMAQINNIVLDLEKSTLNLGSVITTEDGNEQG